MPPPDPKHPMRTHTRLRLRFALLAVLAGCDNGTPMIAGTARVVQGPGVAGGPTPARGRVGALRATAPLRDGIWGITPNQGKATILLLDSENAATLDRRARFTAPCTPTYTRDNQSLSQILDCPFAVP